MKLAALVLACSACSGLEQTSGTCGDGVVDRYEDCDSGPNCRECSIDCSTEACPDGYACGVDKLCHAPGGRFAASGASAVLQYGVLGFGVTDTDGDGYNDVVGLSEDTLDVLLGDAGARLSRETAALIPPLNGPPAVTHIDGDATLDLVIPTPDGLIAYTSPYGVLSPYPFAIEFDTNAMIPKLPIDVVSLDHHYAAGILDLNGKAGLAIIDGARRTTMGFGSPAQICTGLDASKLSPALIDTYDVPAVFPALPTHVIAMATTDGALCVFEMKPPYDVMSYAPGPQVQPGSLLAGKKPLLARLQNGACPSVVGMTTSQTVTEFMASGTLGSCGLSGTRVLPLNAAPVGHVPLQPAVATEGPDAIATQAGIVTVNVATAAATSIYAVTGRSIDEVATLDVDGDTDTDVVFATNGQAGLEVLRRYGTVLPNVVTNDPIGFLAIGIETQGTPRHLLTGDFDGDGIGDITYTEVVDRAERLMIAFGTRDQVVPPKLVSTYNGVAATRKIQLANTSDPTGTKVDDLFVLDSPPQGGDPHSAQLLTVLFGSPQRTLMPFFDPRPPGDMGQLAGAISGVFTDDATAKSYLDLIGLEVGAPSQLWRMVSTANGGMLPDAAVAVNDVSFCAPPPAPPPPPGAFCANSGHMLPYRPSGGLHDVVVGSDGSPSYNVIAIDPLHLDAPVRVSLLDVPPKLEPGLGQRQSYVADIDGDGVPESIIGYGPGRDNSGLTDAMGHIVTCTYDGSLACQTLDVVGLEGWACVDAAPARIIDQQRFDAVSTRQELAVLCRRSGAASAELFRVYYGDDNKYHSAPLLALRLETRLVQIGDINGDGVDDVLAFEDVGQNLTVLRVYPQCTSRDNLDVCPSQGALQ